MPVHKSEDNLVRQAVGRDKAAFGELYDSCVDRVYRHVFYRISNHADTEDITQETFIRAWKAIDRYRRTGAPFVAWLITIADHLIADHYRSRRRSVQTAEERGNTVDHQIVDPQEKAGADFDNTAIRGAVLKLRGDKQKVILMHFIDGFSYREIARALNKSEGAVRVIQHRALEELRVRLR